VPGGCAARLWKTGYVIDLHCLLVDRVEHAVSAGPQAPQIRRLRKRLRRPRLIGQMANALPQRSDTSGIVAEETRRQVKSRISQLTW
jgi:hypothetical protein